MTLLAAKSLVDVSEKELELQAVGTKAKPGVARMVGFLCYHTLHSQGSQRGWPDWACVRERVVYLELKTERNTLSDPQKVWLRALLAAGQEAYLIRPRHLQEITTVLAARANPDTGLLSTAAARDARMVLLDHTREAIA